MEEIGEKSGPSQRFNKGENVGKARESCRRAACRWLQKKREKGKNQCCEWDDVGTFLAFSGYAALFSSLKRAAYPLKAKNIPTSSHSQHWFFPFSLFSVKERMDRYQRRDLPQVSLYM